MPYFILTRFVPQLAANSLRAVVRDLSRTIAADLHWHPVGMEDALSTVKGANHTLCGDRMMVIDVCLEGLDQTYMLIASLRNGMTVPVIADGQSVDLVAVMISPASDVNGHLRRTASMMRELRDSDLCDFLRVTDSQEMVHEILDQKFNRRLAA